MRRYSRGKKTILNAKDLTHCPRSYSAAANGGESQAVGLRRTSARAVTVTPGVKKKAYNFFSGKDFHAFCHLKSKAYLGPPRMPYILPKRGYTTQAGVDGIGKLRAAGGKRPITSCAYDCGRAENASRVRHLRTPRLPAYLSGYGKADNECAGRESEDNEHRNTTRAASPDTENPYMDEPYADRPHPGDPVQYIPYPKNTDKSKTYPENPYPSNPHPYSGASVSDVRVQVRENIGYDCLVTEENREQLDGIVELLTEVLCTRRNFIRISGVDYPAQMVKERFGQINSLHIQYVFECLENTASRIHNTAWKCCWSMP